jgi:HPt (histidine-containing phosphotransfer) domain-containing protein
MDPITLPAAACTAVWNGIKKASEFAQEAEGVWSQLCKYVRAYADQLEQHITDGQEQASETQVVR